MSGEYDGVEWDEQKSIVNSEQRGFGFDFAAQVFAEEFVESENCSRDFGERRFIAIGSVLGVVLTVIWTPRGTSRRIISARRASRRERRIYYGDHQEET